MRLNVESSTATSFYVDLGARSGLKRRGPGPLEGRVLFLDTRPLHAMLMQNVVMLEQKVRSDPLSDRTLRRTEQLNLMTKLAAQVDPEFRPVPRRGERINASGAVDAIVGFTKIAGYLHDEEAHPLAEKRHRTGNFDDSIELATFGHMRNENARVQEVARRLLATYAAPGGAWDIRDVSHTGYRLVAPMSVINSVTLGTLVAIRAHGQSLWTLGIVRRMKRLTSERAEIGLQVIANNLVGVELFEQKRGDADYSVDGVVPTVSGRRFPATVPVAAPARQRGNDPDLDRAGRRISAGQAHADARRQGLAADRIRSPARTAAGMDLGDDRIAGQHRTRRRRDGRLKARAG